MKSLRLFLEGKGKNHTPETAAYLLKLAGCKTPEKTAATIAATIKRDTEKAAAETARASLKENLAYGAKAAALTKSEKDLVAGLASVCAGPNHKVLEIAKNCITRTAP